MIIFLNVIRKVINSIIATAMVFGIFAGCLVIYGSILPITINIKLIIPIALASLVVGIVFPRLWYPIKDWVDETFFPDAFGQMKKLRELSRQILTPVNREELLNKMFSDFAAIGFGAISLLLKDACGPAFRIKRSVGLNDTRTNVGLGLNSPLIKIMREEKEALLRSEVSKYGLDESDRNRLISEMDGLKAEICFPLYSTRNVKALFGVIALGDSTLGASAYGDRNIFWLAALINNVGMMLDKFYHQEFANAIIPHVGRAWAEGMHKNKDGFVERQCSRKKWVSIVMVDIRHFTKICAHLDPNEAVGLLKEFRSRVSAVVYEYEGMIDKFIGDAIMIVFDSPLFPTTYPDKKAVMCASAVLKSVEELNENRLKVNGKGRISVGIGIASGDVIAGNVDSGDRLEYTVIGDAANLVAKLEERAGENQILLSHETYERVKETVEVKTRKPEKIEGLDRPITIHEFRRVMMTHSKTEDVQKSRRRAVNE